MYSNWEEKSMLIPSMFNWYLVDDVIDYLHEVRTYVINTPGKFSASYMPKLKDNRHQDVVEPSSPLLFGIPASQNSRFPVDKVYLCEAIGECSQLLDRLQLACNIMVNTNRLERKYPEFDTAGRLEFYVLELISNMLQYIETREDLITQQIFENRYDLNWSGTPNNKETLLNNQSSSSKE